MGNPLLLGAGTPVGIDFTNWWLSGGVNAANCFGAYRGKGAASAAASLSNLNNPGTHDLYWSGLLDNAGAPLPAMPAWAAGSGWLLSASATGGAGYFRMTGGFFPTQAMSVLMQFTDAADFSMQFCGASTWTGAAGSRGDGISINNTGSFQDIYNWNGPSGDLKGGILNAGNYAIAGKTFYRDGAVSLTLTAGTGTNANDWNWGCENWAGTAHGAGPVTMVAMACYTTTLTDAQVAAIAAKMALM